MVYWGGMNKKDYQNLAMSILVFDEPVRDLSEFEATREHYGDYVKFVADVELVDSLPLTIS